MKFFIPDSKLFRNIRRLTTYIPRIPTIGIAGVTNSEAAFCYKEIDRQSRLHFPAQSALNVILHHYGFMHISHATPDIKRWDLVEDRLVRSIICLQRAHAQLAIIPSDAAHKVIKRIQQRSEIPVISMLDVAVEACNIAQVKKVGVLGTHLVMADHIYCKSLKDKGIEEVVPSAKDQEVIKQITAELMQKGKIHYPTIKKLLKIIERLKALGCDGIILACPELAAVLNEKNCGLPTFATHALLANAAVTDGYSLLKNNLAQQEQAIAEKPVVFKKLTI